MAQAAHDLTAAEAATLIASRRLSPAELMAGLRSRIESTEPVLQAWAHLNPDELGPGGPGPLHGVPFGVKDVIDVGGLPTGCGFEPFAKRIADSDATAVARLRSAGALPVGKTATTQFAFRDPPPTLNPWDPGRSPGGSSTGSAVAVAMRQVPFALGTQTSGSVLRPAAFNGVVGFKPTFGRVSKQGVFPDAWSLDHVGVLARTVEDCRVVLAAMEGWDPADPTSAPARPARRALSGPPRLGLLREALELASSEVGEHVDAAARHFLSEGAEVVEVRLSYPIALIHSVHQVTMESEMAAAHRDLLDLYPDEYRAGLRAFLEVGAAIPAWAYVHAQRIRRRIAVELAQSLAEVDAIMLPTCSSLPPLRGAGTGDSSYQAPFSLAGVPSISLPSKPGPSGLPLAFQLAAPVWEDHLLLAVAGWCEARLEPMPAPPFPSQPKE